MIEASNYRATASGTRLGFVDITLTNVGIRIRDCVHHESHGKEWVQLPARAQVTDGELRRNERGKIQYAKTIDFTSDRVSRSFRNQAVEAIHRLNGDGHE